jgi:hypothetical protein
MNFREILEAKTRESIEATAYCAGGDDYLQGMFYLNPFHEGTKAHLDYFNGYEDARYLQTMERFEYRVAA